MGAITRININNLFWLGRYVQRVFITLDSFFKYADRFIEGGEAAYKKYLDDIMNGSKNTYSGPIKNGSIPTLGESAFEDLTEINDSELSKKLKLK